MEHDGITPMRIALVLRGTPQRRLVHMEGGRKNDQYCFFPSDLELATRYLS